MKSSSAPPGPEGQALAADPGSRAVSVPKDDLVWPEYLRSPSDELLGVCSSGGGVRSASFSLGALQVLQEHGVLGRTDHIACVSGGGYITVAHALLVSETLQRADPNDLQTPSEGLGPGGIEEEIFGKLKPWSRASPEESHLRNYINYLGSRVWLVANLIYGTIRHLLPFVAAIYLLAFVLGLALSSWLAGTLQVGKDTPCDVAACVTNSDLVPFLWVGTGFLLLAGLLLAIRNTGQTGGFSNGPMSLLQYLGIATIYAALAVLAVLVVLPWVFLRLHNGALQALGPFGDLRTDGISLTVAAGIIGAVVSWIAKKRTTRWFQIAIAIVTALAAPIFILVPLAGLSYWNAQWGADWSHDPKRLWLAVVSVAYLFAMWRFFDEVTSVAHLFYRERLATAFVGYRRLDRCDPLDSQRYEQPPWEQSLDFSKLVTGKGAAKLPNLVVCAAVNLSSDNLPVGRMAASFTFERDRVGGPATGYVTTPWMEARAGEGVITLPALMAISGAAVAPSMGKMTVPALRFLMAVFDFRLGAWLPNPATSPMRASARALRVQQPGNMDPTAVQPPSQFLKKSGRPGAWYVFCEAFGLNSIRRSFVYVTDGGHWENLGLVELLRRGCTRIVCIDGSGGDAVTFGTLSEAIALARSDLGVEIRIDLSRMRAPKGELSESGFAFGRMTFPTGTTGTLVYIRALLAKTSPEELRSYAGKDKKFPNHPTGDQFFDEERFEAYRALGHHLAEQALRYGDVTLEVPSPEVSSR